MEFMPLVANDYLADILESGYIDVTKPNGDKAFISSEKLTHLIKSLTCSKQIIFHCGLRTITLDPS